MISTGVPNPLELDLSGDTAPFKGFHRKGPRASDCRAVYYNVRGLGFRVTWNSKRIQPPCRDYMGFILGLYWDNGKENGNYYSILGLLYRDNGKENGNYYSTPDLFLPFRVKAPLLALD